MKRNHRKYFYLLITLLCVKASSAQISSTTVPVFTADSIKSGSAKDILTSFYQLALNNLAGSNRQFNFSSNPFAIMLKRNPKLNIDTKYKKYQPLRKLNFDIGLKVDSSFNFNGFTSGIKYSLIDQTDVTTSNLMFQTLRRDSLNKERNVLFSILTNYEKIKFPNANDPNSPDFAEKEKFDENKTNIVQDIPFSKLDSGFKEIVKKIVKDNHLDKIADVFNNKPDSSFKQIDSIKFEALKNSIKNNLLWTIGLSDTTYNDKFQFSNIVIASELSKGLFDPEPGDNNLEIILKAAYSFSDDTLKQGRNLKREIFSFEPGLNWVIRDRTTDRSFFEFKLSGSYYHNFASIYNNEKRDSLTLNATLRIRAINDIWIPLEIKYDPKNGHVFAVLNIKANFTGLASLLKGSSSKNQ